jgi:hypothetical protein
MPSSEVILWAGISSLILIMLAIIGYLISTGFESLKDQLKTLWDKIDLHQALAETNALKIVAIETRCRELHTQRWTDMPPRKDNGC